MQSNKRPKKQTNKRCNSKYPETVYLPTLRIFSVRSSGEKPRFLFRPCLRLSPSRTYESFPRECNVLSSEHARVLLPAEMIREHYTKTEDRLEGGLVNTMVMGQSKTISSNIWWSHHPKSVETCDTAYEIRCCAYTDCKDSRHGCL